jgi:hypothetical protein
MIVQPLHSNCIDYKSITKHCEQPVVWFKTYIISSYCRLVIAYYRISPPSTVWEPPYLLIAACTNCFAYYRLGTALTALNHFNGFLLPRTALVPRFGSS